MRQAVVLWEEPEEHEAALKALSEPYQPTRGLIIRTMVVPTQIGGPVHLQLCDAGGRAEYRRQWSALIRDAEVCALVFVASALDASEESRDLFAQLVRAPWARDANVLLALTHIDAATAQDAATREAAYRDLASGHTLGCHALNCHDADAARQLLLAAAASAQ